VTDREDLLGGATRHIALEGAVNFRDLGGYETVDGRTISWRTLFRADGLSELTDRDRGVVRHLGVATVVDLRTSSELEGGRFPVDDIPVRFHHHPLLDELPDPEAFKLAPGVLSDQYLDMCERAGPQIGEVLSILARPGAHPAIVHCTAGKDRTGVLVAVLLGLLGVPDDVIVADYALSAGAMAGVRDKLIARYPEGRQAIEQANEVFSAAPSNISGLLATLRDRYGSIVAYGESVGAGPEVVAGLRRELLD
jgi:protein-tyrosine phosphatase